MRPAPADPASVAEPGPGFEAWMPCRWQAWTPAADSPARHESNLRMLRVIATLETRENEPAEDDPLAQEFARLHDKVDLMLEMMAGLYERAGSVSSRRVQVTWRQLRLDDADLPWPGVLVLLELWLHPLIARPLVLAATRLAAEGSCGEAAAVFEIETLEGELGAAWERYVFRQHRREVSRGRQSR